MESNPLDETLEQRLANPEYKNWVKAVMCLSSAKEGLENFTESESKELHYDIFSTVTPCGKCFQINNLCHPCGQMKREIEKWHIGKPVWTNTDVQKWSDYPNSHWFIAKCYMNDGQKMTNSANGSDISSILNFIINCRRFCTYGNIQSNARKVRDDRNKLIHSGEQKLSDSDLTSCADNILKLLEDDKPAGKLKGSRDAGKAQTKIKEILKISFAIMLEDEIKVKLFACEGHIDWINSKLKRMDQKLTTELQAKSSNQDQKIKQTEDQVTNLREEITTMKTTLDKISESIKVSKNLEQELNALKDLKGEIVEIHRILARLEQASDSQLKNMDKLQQDFASQKSDFEKLCLDLSSHSSNTKNIHQKLKDNTIHIDLIERRSQSLKRKCDERYEQVNSRVKKVAKSVNTISNTIENLKNRVDPRVSILEGNFSTLERKLNKCQEEQATYNQNMDILYTRTQQAVPRPAGKFEQHEVTQQQRDADVDLQKPGKTKRKSQPIDKEHPTKRKPESSGLRLLKVQTEDEIDTFKTLGHIPTTQAEAARRLLQIKRSVVIKGNPGEGKTTMALHLIDNEMYRNRRVVLYRPKDWEKVVTDWVDIVILEDIFGSLDLDSDRLQEWMVCLPNIQKHVNAGKLQLIVTTRVDILAKAHSKIESLKIFSEDLSLTLSSEQLKPSEKIAILNRQLLTNDRNMKDNAKEKCITNFRGLIGFPQCCALFAGDSMLFDRGPEFFKSPKQFFIANIKGLDHTGFLPLAFLFCNGDILEEYLSPETMPESSKDLLIDLALCLHISKEKASITFLRDTYDNFMDLYIKKSMSYKFADKRPCIRFVHATVFEAVGQILGDRCLEMVVKYSGSEYLYQRTYTAEVKDSSSQNLFLPPFVHGLLAKRMVRDIVDAKSVRSVVKHSALEQREFVIKLKDELHKTGKVKEFFTAKHYLLSILDPLESQLQESLTQCNRIMDMFKIKQLSTIGSNLSEGHCFTFMQYILQIDENVVQLVYNQFLEFLECTHDTSITDCWQCKERQKLLELAIYYNHFQIADKLIAMKTAYTHVSLCNACRHGDKKRVQVIIGMLKKNRIFNPECKEAKDALCRAYFSGNQGLIELLLNELIKLNSSHIVDAAKGDFHVLKTIVEHLRCHNNWTPELERGTDMMLFPPSCHFGKDVSNYIRPCFNALCLTYSDEKFDMADYLLTNGVKATMEMLMHISTSSSQKAIPRLIENIKEAGTWDPRCNYASKALEIAYILHTFEVLDLLVQEGVVLKISSLDVVVLNSSFDLVRKAIQHLKDNDKWDSKCDHASKALEMAWKHKHAVCDLLVQEGVTLRMKNFPGVVDSVSFESVKKAIQHLKDADNWYPKCGDASEALENAYNKQKFDVLDLLVQEGVKLTMKNFPGVVNSVSFDYVKTAIKHLQENNNWDSKCDEASEALENAYKKEKYDVSDLLVEEGVKLTMQNLPAVVISVSLKRVKKAMQHLKESENWDPKCSHASAALIVCCIQQKHDKFYLLVKEGVALTMRTLNDVIMASHTPQEFVKTSIQHLKDTNNWDSKSNDASEALEMAWKHRHDVCELLIHEGVTLRMKNLPGIVDSVSLESVKKAIQHLKGTDTWDSTCDDASQALEIAYTKEKHYVIDLLVQEGVKLTMKNLPGVANSVSSEHVIKATQHLKDTNNWNSKCDYASEALRNTCIQLKHDLFDMLVRDGVVLTMKDLLWVIIAFQASVDSARKAIQHLKDFKNWDSKSKLASKILEIVYCIGVPKQHLQETVNWDFKDGGASKTLKITYSLHKQQIFDFLLQEGVTLTMKNLSGVVSQVPLEYVKKAINHLKDTENWDCNSEYASKALATAYSQQKDDVCALLIQEGLTLTAKVLQYVVAKSVCLETVKNALQHLKENDKWIPRCDHAVHALVIAYSQKKFDFCVLLVQEGIMLTMKNLPEVVANSASSESVQKAICHLKDSCNWISNCDDACIAFEIALSQQKHDVLSLLVQEGITISMKILPRAVYNVSLECFKIAIQRFRKNKNWDPKCEHVLVALELAYNKNEYTVFDMLIKQEFTLVLKVMTGAVYDVSLDFVKKTIQYLKDDNKWDSTSDDALKALVIAYSTRRYDACDLLVQEGSKLTVEYLSAVVVNSQSVESVSKAIQHLRITDNWDAKSNNALIALVISYIHQRYDVCGLLVQEGLTVSMQILPLLVANSVSLESLKKVIQHLKDTDHWISKCNDAYMTLAFAFRQQKHDILSLLVQEGLTVTMKFLPYLLFSLSLESVKIAIQNLKCNANWDSKYDDAFRALDLAYNKKEYDTFDMLVNQVFMSGVVNDISLEVVKKAIQYLKDTNIWNSTCDDALEALVIAYSTQRYDVCVLLVQEGFKLTAKNLPSVVVSSQSLESVNKAMQHLKDNNNWDAKSNYALIALLFAYIHQKYDVCGLLVQEGLMLAMQILPHLVANSDSLESVKKAVQHMKDTGNWIPNCDDACIALVVAFSRQKHDLLSLLVQEGLIFTMKIMSYVVFNMTLESVKIAIQNLKDNAKWDSNYEDAFRALELAYNKKEYHVFDMLVDQGFTLARKSIYGVVYDASFEFVQKIIQYLKDTHKWDSSCDDALDALVIAFSHQRFDVCALLAQEGFKLTVKNLPALVTNSLSLESVKRAIQHLKDTDNWDPKTDDAYKALVIAYSQRKHDVCVLLFQEGLIYAMKILPCVLPNVVLSESDQRAVQNVKDSDSSDPNSNDAPKALSCCYSQQKHDVSNIPVHVGLILTMQSLLGMVINCESFESIEKAIQQMKYTNNWDAKSDDAILALVIAYSQHRYDVCVLLLQEGLVLAMKILPWVVANSDSSESVKKAIQHLKDSGIWDSMSDDALIALVFAYIQQKYDICILLVKEGLALTMQMFPEVVANSVSLESVKKVIQHLKDTGNWISKCDDAYRTLLIAFSQQKHDIISLLVQEGIVLAMRILPYVVYNVSLECVTKAIQNRKDNANWDSKCENAFIALQLAYNIKDYDAFDKLVQQVFVLGWKSISGFLYDVSLEFVKNAIQHLKTTNKWNSKCGDAVNALVIAYSKKRYDVCALLHQEGLELTVKNLSEVVLNSPSLESVTKAIQHLKDTDNWDASSEDALKALVIAYFQQKYDVCVVLFQEGLTITMKILPLLVANTVSPQPLEKAIQHLKDTDNWDSKCDDASESLVICYVKQKHELSEMLVHEGFTLTMKHLPDVVRDSTSMESVKKAVHHLKDTKNWNCMVHDALKALVIAYIQQKHDVCVVLSQEGLTATMKILPLLVANIVSVEALYKAIQHLKDTDNWDSKCDDASEALVICYVKQKNDMAVILANEGLTLTMKHLSDVIRDSKSLKSVKSAIQHLKDTDNWDCNVHYPVKGLVIAYIQQKYDVCGVLFQEGLTITMKILPLLVANIVSLEPLKKAIEHLKETNNWDSKSNDASTALELAYSQQKYDVVDMLVLMEVALTMKNLPHVVDSGSLESVKKAIQHLKETDIWDSTCDNAKQALETAYIKNKTDVLDLLAEENVTLSMKHLPGVVTSTLTEYVRKAIQSLKDTGKWDFDSFDASKALEMVWKHKCEICDLLLDEGVTLTMKNLPGVVVNSLSLESINKAIQHLKDTGNWDSKCDDASKTLEIAWELKHDVYDLLLHEEVTLTMCNLHGVVLKSSSPDSVKNAIQHLKDTDNWDSKSTDAQIAVEFAYRAHKYDVVDLLVQEGVILTMKNLPGVICDVPLEYVKKTIQHLKVIGNWDPKCNDASTALEIAYMLHKYDVTDLLVQEGFALTMMNFFGVVAYASLKYVEKVMQDLKDSDKWDPKCACASTALEIAYRHPTHDVFDLLAQEGITLIIMCLPDLVLTESLESVKKVIQLLKDTYNWDPNCVDASKALENTYIKHDYSVGDLLVQEGVSLAMRNFPIVVDHLSLKTIEKAMQHLKDTGTWDPKSDHAAKALETSLSKQKYDVFSLLVQEGVTLTMKNIPGVVDSVSLKSVEKAVQHLKETGNWDPKCDDASKALELGWKHKYVFDLLVKEGVTLTMKNLPLVAYHMSCESIKKVIQHLKDNDNWDSKCDHASVALEAAYTKQKYQVIDLLVKEGVSLTMKNVPHMVDSTSLEPIKKAIQHLKDTSNWNPKCEHASTALETALTKQKYEVFDLLVQVGITLTMKNFPGVVESVSVKSVKKAIQHLKDTGNWNSKCDDASSAFEIAWKKQCYLCDLLVKEGVTLPIKNLPPVVETVSYKEAEQYCNSICAIVNQLELMHRQQ